MRSAAHRIESIRALAVTQAGLLTRDQLRACGVDADGVRNQVAAGRWILLSRRVVALQTGPLTGRQQAWFAVLDGGDGCVLAGLSALHAHGLKGFPTDRVHTVLPFGAGRPARHDLYLRRVSRRLTDTDVHPVRRPPTMRVLPALLDALEATTLPLRGSALLAAVVQQRLVPADTLHPLVAAARTLPHRRAYLAVAGDIEGGAHSLTEIDFRRLARRAGIRPPVGQSMRTDRSGRRRYLDADFGTWAAEVDGAVHLRPLNWWDDAWRLNEILIDGKPTLRFPSVGLYLRPDMVVVQLRRAAARWGGGM